MKDRRDFLKSLAALTAVTMIPYDGIGQTDRLGDLLPLRRLGKTGKQITMLGVGGAHIGRSSEKVAQEMNQALRSNGSSPLH